MIVNATEVSEGESFKGSLMDSYGQGVPNKTITYHKGQGKITILSMGR